MVEWIINYCIDESYSSHFKDYALKPWLDSSSHDDILSCDVGGVFWAEKWDKATDLLRLAKPLDVHILQRLWGRKLIWRYLKKL